MDPETGESPDISRVFIAVDVERDSVVYRGIGNEDPNETQ